MRTTVDDVHHRNRHGIGVATTDVTVERQTQGVGSSLGSSQRNTEDSVGTELTLGGSSVEGQHLVVKSTLIENAVTFEGWSDNGVHIFNSFQGTLTQIAVLVTVAELESLILTSGSTRGNGSAAHYTIFQHYVYLNGGVATRVEDFSCMNFLNLHNFTLILKCYKCYLRCKIIKKKAITVVLPFVINDF